MGLISLDIHSVRNLKSVRLSPGPGFNFLIGRNASGKTSFMEAIHILGRGSSFRTSKLREIASKGTDAFSINGKVENNRVFNTLSMKFAQGKPAYLVDQMGIKRRAELVELLPLQIINPESHRLLSDGPVFRRRYLDWGLFHVEQSFYAAWCRYQRALKQRNAALRTNKLRDSIPVWDQELALAANTIDRLRRDYLESLIPYLLSYISQLVYIENIEFEYEQGWRSGHDYAEVLKLSLAQDLAYGYSRNGPHRADLLVKVEGRSAQSVVSRGQQKLLICAMLIAQAALLKARRDKGCVFLIDDLAAELDEHHRQRLLALFNKLHAQTFITGTDQHLLDGCSLPPDTKVFHVEHGVITEQASGAAC